MGVKLPIPTPIIRHVAMNTIPLLRRNSMFYTGGGYSIRFILSVAKDLLAVEPERSFVACASASAGRQPTLLERLPLLPTARRSRLAPRAPLRAARASAEASADRGWR